MRCAILLLVPFVMAAEQFQLWAPSPSQIGSGVYTKDFDPAVYGPIEGYSVFSAAGDAIAYATVSDRHIEIHYSSETRSIGQLPGLPILTINVPRLAPEGVAIDSVTPLAPTRLRVKGAHFTASTPVSIDGVAVASVELVNERELVVNLGGVVELTGRRLRVGAADHFLAFPSGTGKLQMVPPLRPFTWGLILNRLAGHGRSDSTVALVNPADVPVTVALYSFGAARMVRLEPCATGLVDITDVAQSGTISLVATASVRALLHSEQPNPYGEGQRVTLDSPFLPPGGVFPLRVALSTDSVAWSWAPGMPAPAAATIALKGNLPFTVSPSTASWLAVTTSPTAITLRPTPDALPPGLHETSITVAPAVPGIEGVPVTVSVRMTVGAGPLVQSTADCCFFRVTVGDPSPRFSLPLSSSGDPVEFTTLVSAPWLSVTPSAGKAPATLTVVADPTGLSTAGQHSATLSVKGRWNTLTYEVVLQVNPVYPAILPDPSSLEYALEAGSPAPPDRLIRLNPGGRVFAVSSDAAWLAVSTAATTPVQTLSVAIRPAGLTPATYRGKISVSSGADSLSIPVTLTVVSRPEPQTRIVASPAALELQAPVDEQPVATVKIDGAGQPLLLSMEPQPFGQPWTPIVSVESASSTSPEEFVTPATLTVRASSVLPGDYTGTIRLRTRDGIALTIPVHYVATPSRETPPFLAHLVNSATMRDAPLAPLSAYTILGGSLGPGSRVSMNGAAAEILYSSPGQLNFLTPGELGGRALVRVETPGNRPAEWVAAVAPAVPAIFTIDGSGAGQGAVLNQDNSVNGPSRPAARGSVIQIFTNSPAPEEVTIGGVAAMIQYAGRYQVNAVVPQSVAPGSAVPVVISIGGVQSPATVTIVVE